MQLHNKTFTELTTTELYSILAARSAVFVLEQHCIYKDPDGIDLRSRHLFLEEQGEILAYLRMFEKEGEPNTVQIGRVLTTVRGKGYGMQVLLEAVRTAPETMHAQTLFMEAQCHAIGFYEKAGFQVVSEPFWEEEILHVCMTRKVEQQDKT